MVTTIWTSPEKRALDIESQERLGYRLLHDDFIDDSERLTFTDESDLVAEADNWELEYASAATLSEKIDVLAHRLGIRKHV